MHPYERRSKLGRLLIVGQHREPRLRAGHKSRRPYAICRNFIGITCVAKQNGGVKFGLSNERLSP